MVSSRREGDVDNMERESKAGRGGQQPEAKSLAYYSPFCTHFRTYERCF